MEEKNFKPVVYVDKFTDGILDPNKEMEYFVKDEGYIIANTAPGCWGPMITPKLKGGHEVAKPVYVEGAEVGDSVAIYVKGVQVTSLATASGHDVVMEGRYEGDPFVLKKCPNCGTVRPDTRIEGTGPDAVRCAVCGADVSPFRIENGYTIVFDHQKGIGITVSEEIADQIGQDPRYYMQTPANSVQNPVVVMAPHDLVGTVARMRPFLGQLGSTPSIPFPDSHNAGDFGQLLINAPHEYGMTKEQLDEHRTDGHMDIKMVRPGAVVIVPVKVKGAGIYVGDMHAMQGNGEIAGHTTDVAGIATLQVKVLKGVTIKGPIILPNVEDLPDVAKPFSDEEMDAAYGLIQAWGQQQIEESYPLSFVGTGATINDATENGLRRASEFLGIPYGEVLNRATITGEIGIGRLPGVVTVTMLVPEEILERKDLITLVEEKYR
ncbi:acetamidase/formamidase family protein [Coprothermobacter platensis]|uniref:acetamidase/formamidase family protein n=1 Tax=Coprothermobacter platensis TaxID=108819 RepID=UPI0003660175|nr:acetamidase/formamidase family protein [Coprothermobacter platensis]